MLGSKTHFPRPFPVTGDVRTKMSACLAGYGFIPIPRLQGGKCDASICVVFAYFGPETVMPVTSILATVAAVVMMFGKSHLPTRCRLGSHGLVRGRRGQAAPRLTLRSAGGGEPSEAEAAGRARSSERMTD